MSERKEAELKLKTSEEKFRKFFKRSPYFVLAWEKINNDFIIIDYNDIADDITNGKIKQMIGTTASERYLTDIYRPDLIENINECFEEKSNFEKNIKLYIDFFKNERDILIFYNYIPPNIVLTYMTDITMRISAEEKLKESEKKYRLLSENANDIICSITREGKLFSYNEALIIKLGYAPEDIQEIKVINISHPEDKKHLTESYKKLLKKGTGINEARFKCKDGSYKWLETTSNVIYDDEGKPLRIFCVSRDISERKIMEEKLVKSEEDLKILNKQLEQKVKERTKELEESRKIYKNLIEGAKEVLYRMALPKGHYEYFSPAAKLVFGYSNEEFMNNPLLIKEIIHPDYNEYFKKNWNNLLKGIVPQNYEYKIIDKFNKERWIMQSNRGIFNKEGKIIAIEGICRNITNQKKAELALKESEEKYRKAYNQVNFYKDLFAHDMFNILQNILSSSELCEIYLENNKNQNRINELLGIITDQVKKGSNLIFKVQKLSEIEDALLPMESKNICEYLKKAIDFVKDSFQTKVLNIQVESFSKNILVQANDLLFDVFENILINGIRHNFNSKVDLFIKISEEQNKGMKLLKIEFKDNGIGIKNDHKEIIFHRDVKRDKKARGMGLGLSLVKKIIDSYNGKIWVEDRIKGDETKGSNFILLIPRTE